MVLCTTNISLLCNSVYLYDFCIIVIDGVCMCIVLWNISNLCISTICIYHIHYFYIIVIDSVCQHRQEPLAPACVCMVLCIFTICIFCFYITILDSICICMVLFIFNISVLCIFMICYMYIIVIDSVCMCIVYYIPSPHAPFTFSHSSLTPPPPFTHPSCISHFQTHAYIPPII